MNSSLSTSAAPEGARSTSATRVPPVHVRTRNEFAITIRATPKEVYAFWRNLENLPRFMKDLAEVKVLDSTRSQWVVRLRDGASASWEAEITRDDPDRGLAWRSTEGSEVKTAGFVNFWKAGADRGTVVALSMDYSVPGGKLGELFAKFTGEDPRSLILTNLKRLKAILETGEIATTEGQPSGREPREVTH